MKPNTIVYLACILSCSCTNSKQQGARSGLLDSISAKADISFSQIKQHTLIDDSYFTSKSTFSGDTLYYPNSDYPIAVISYNDNLVCTKKILLIYDKKTLKNTAWLLIATDCDEDYSTDYSRLSYKIFNNRQFFTREVQHLREEGKKTRVTVADKFYRIGDNGKIELLNKKPSGITLPIFDAKDEITEEDN